MGGKQKERKEGWVSGMTGLFVSFGVLRACGVLVVCVCASSKLGFSRKQSAARESCRIYHMIAVLFFGLISRRSKIFYLLSLILRTKRCITGSHSWLFALFLLYCIEYIGGSRLGSGMSSTHEYTSMSSLHTLSISTLGFGVGCDGDPSLRGFGLQASGRSVAWHGNARSSYELPNIYMTIRHGITTYQTTI